MLQPQHAVPAVLGSDVCIKDMQCYYNTSSVTVGSRQVLMTPIAAAIPVQLQEEHMCAQGSVS